MRYFVLAMTFMAMSCGVSSGGRSIPAPPVDSSYRGLLFLAGDDSYQAASLYYYDFVAGRIVELSRQESGMAALFALGRDVLLVNRSEERHNWRLLTFERGLWRIGPQKALGGEPGDPLAVHPLNKRHLVRANYSAGNLSLLDLEAQPQVSRDVALSFNAGPNQPLRPVDFWGASHSNAQWVYLLHQGIRADFVTANQTQAVYVLKPDEFGFVSPVDLNPSTATVTGISLQMTAPERFLHYPDDPNPWIAGACSAYLKGNCRSGVAQLIPAEQRVVEVYAWDDHDWKMNGSMVAGLEPGQFYAQMAAAEAGEGAVVVFVDAQAQQTSEFYRYAAGDRGQWPMFVDRSQELLLVTTSLSELSGQLVVLNFAGEQVVEATLPGNVFSGVLVK